LAARMTGAIEQGAKVATSVVDGLKSQPLSLALIIMNLVFVGFVAWLANEFNERTTHQYEVKDQLIAKLLDQCKASQQSQQQ
jgi:hypothetical protein